MRGIAEAARLRAERPEAVLEAAAARETRPLGSRLPPSPPTTRLAECWACATTRSRWPTAGSCCGGWWWRWTGPAWTVLGTADVLEDLLLLGALEGKVVIGSMNRGGLEGAVFELDDRFTAMDAATICAAVGFDGGKMLTRIALDDPGTAPTLEASANAISELADRGLMAMVEPFLSSRVTARCATTSAPKA